MAAVRPLHMPEPPPLISSNKPGGSITQVQYTNVSPENRSTHLEVMGKVNGVLPCTMVTVVALWFAGNPSAAA